MKFKHRCLIIAIACYAVCAGIIAYWWAAPARGESSVMVTYEPESNIFERGIGLEINTEHRFGPVAVGGSGSIADQKKHEAADGYTWGADVYGKYFPVGQYFVGSGWSWHGYRSRFDDHGPWEKRGDQPMVLAGLQTPDTELRFTWWPRETDTPNRVSAFGAGLKQHIAEHLILSTDFQAVKYKQAGRREVDMGVEIGVGVYF